ncbi:MAG: VanZ family protein [Firmicutes bacterium]|nr:VanZ family protein [Bacillota bacterium]
METRNKTKSVYLLLGIYCVVLVWIILFKLSFSLEELQAMIGTSEINLIPFYYEDDVDFHMKEVLNNLLIFIPFGLYLSMLHIDGKKTVFFGFLFSFVLEMAQYIFNLGSYDITDLLMNTAGTAVGISIHFLFTKLFRSTEKANKLLTILASVATVLCVTLLLLLVFLN